MLPVQPLALLRLPVAVAALAVLAALFLFPGTAYAAEPVFNTGLSSTVSVPENTAAETDIGAPYTATDTDTADTLTYHLSGTDASSFDIGESDGQLKTNAALDFETKTSYDVIVGVRDSTTDTTDDATMNVTITVTNVNEPPNIDTTTTTYNFAANTLVTTAVATLEATDPESGDTLTWTISGADMGDFNITTDSDQDGVLTFKVSPNFESPTGNPAMMGDDPDNTYEVTVNVRDSLDSAGVDDTGVDDTGVDDSIDVEITVTNVNEAPTITTTTTSKDFAENQPASTAVETFAATDVDTSTTLTWSVESGDDGGKFDINSLMGVLTFKNLPNFEMPGQSGSTDNEYKVTVKVTDNGTPVMSDSQLLTVTVTNVNEAPTITSGPSSFNKNENTEITEVIASYVASDVDADDNPVNLTWTLEGEDMGDFTIMKNSGTNDAELRFSAVPDYEMPTDNGANNVYNVTVKVYDGSLSNTRSVAVTVTNVNEAPTIDSGPTAKNFPENSTGVVATYEASDVDDMTTLTWSKEGDDESDFTLTENFDQTGYELKFASTPNYEMPGDADTLNNYEVTVKVTDDGIPNDRTPSNHLDATLNVTVTVDDVNETTVITGDETPSFAEIEYDDDATPTELVIGTYSATDDDNSDNLGLQTITWGVNGTDAAHFSINSAAGELSFSIEPDYEDPADLADSENMGATDNEYVVVVEADDGQGGTNSVGTFTVTVSVTDVNERPDIREDTVANYMEVEYDFSGTLTEVHTFAATDYDDMDTFEWSLHGEDADHLDIGSTSGVLTFNQPSGICLNDGPLPDYEKPCDAATGGTNTYNVNVRATDDDTSNQKYSDYAVTITVTDVNERPDITEDTVPDYMEVDFYYDGTPSDVHTFTATDYDDMDTYQWSLSGDDTDDLEIDSVSGVLSFTQNDDPMVDPLPSYEDPQDQNGDNNYSITVVATDNHNKAGEYPVTITVTDAEEEGRVAAELPNDPPLVDDVLTFTLSDPDGGILLISGDIDWTIEARVPADPPGEWEPIDDADPLMLGRRTPSMKTTPARKCALRSSMRTAGAQARRRRAGKAARYRTNVTLRLPGSVPAQLRRSRRGNLAETPERKSRPPTVMARP